MINNTNTEDITEYKVTFGGFWGNSETDEVSEKIPVGKNFRWDGEDWYIPAVYIFEKGVVIDICKKTEPHIMKAFIDKWGFLDDSDLSDMQYEEVQNENPLNSAFEVFLDLNRELLQRKISSTVSWIPENLSRKSDESEAKCTAKHYKLDMSYCWTFHRCCFAYSEKPEIRLLKMIMKRRPINVHGIKFGSLPPDSIVDFKNPVTGIEHTLTIKKYERQIFDENDFSDGFEECSKSIAYFTVLYYTVYPDIPKDDFFIRDCKDSDAAFSFMVIYNKDAENTENIALSSLYSEPPENIEWYMSFKAYPTAEDIEVNLINF